MSTREILDRTRQSFLSPSPPANEPRSAIEPQRLRCDMAPPSGNAIAIGSGQLTQPWPSSAEQDEVTAQIGHARSARKPTTSDRSGFLIGTSRQQPQQESPVQMNQVTSPVAGQAATDPASISESDEHIDVVRCQIFQSLCSALESAEIPYVVLSGHHDYPRSFASDIDFMVSEADFDRLAEILGRPELFFGARVIQTIDHEISARYFVLARQEGYRIAYLHPDATASYRLGTRLWLRSESVLATRRRSPGDFWIAAAAVEFEYYFVKRVEKRSLEARHLEQLSALYAEDAAGCRAALERLMPASLVETIASAIQEHDVPWFATHRDVLEGSLTVNAEIESIWPRIRSRIENLGRLVRRVFVPTGFVIAVLGADGSGKSTVIEHIEKQFSPAFRRVRRYHLRPHFGRPTAGSRVSDPHAREARGRLTSFLKLLIYVADYWLSWPKVIVPARIRSTLIIFDRYYQDMLVDRRRYRLPNGFQMPHWLSTLIPKPDMWIVLTSTPEELVARKGEISLSAARTLDAAYVELASRLEDSTLIDTNGSLEATLERSVTAVRERLEARACHILPSL